MNHGATIKSMLLNTANLQEDQPVHPITDVRTRLTQTIIFTIVAAGNVSPGRAELTSVQLAAVYIRTTTQQLTLAPLPEVKLDASLSLVILLHITRHCSEFKTH